MIAAQKLHRDVHSAPSISRIVMVIGVLSGHGTIMQVLLKLEERHPGATAYHFIEDKLSTLEKARARLHRAGLLRPACLLTRWQGRHGL